jgi:hypothetical protein
LPRIGRNVPWITTDRPVDGDIDEEADVRGAGVKWPV